MRNMKKKADYEIVQVEDEYMAVPVGEETLTFKGVVTLSESAAFLLKHMEQPKSMEDLLGLLTQEYEVDEETARADLARIIEIFLNLGLITE